MLYTRHDIDNRAGNIANSIILQLEGPPYLSPSNRADKQVYTNLSLCILYHNKYPLVY